MPKTTQSYPDGAPHRADIAAMAAHTKPEGYQEFQHTTAQIRETADSLGHKPYAKAEYQISKDMEPLAVEIVSYPCWDNATDQTVIFVRTVPDDPTSAIWINANFLR